MDSSRPPPRTGRLSHPGNAPNATHGALPSPAPRPPWNDETPAPAPGFHDTWTPDATVPVGSISPVAHWASEQTSSDGTPLVLHAAPMPVDPAPRSSIDLPRPPSRVTQQGLPDARSFLAEAEATVLTVAGGDPPPPDEAPATLPIGSMSSVAHMPLVSTRPSPFDSLAPAAPTPNPLPHTTPHLPPKSQWGLPPSPSPDLSRSLSTALPPRQAAPWQPPPMPAPQGPSQPSRATGVLLLVGLVIVSVLVMVTLVIALIASRR